MERLSDSAIKIVDELHTERLSYESVYVPIIDALNCLAEYEDTGLEPKEIQEAVDLFKDWRNVDIPKELKSWVERCTWHVRKCEELRRELDEYKKAKSEGRLVILPCKLGDTVYSIVDNCTFPGDCGTKRMCKGCEYRNLFIEEDVFHLCLLTDSGKLKSGYYPTREAAEKALEGNNEQT